VSRKYAHKEAVVFNNIFQNSTSKNYTPKQVIWYVTAPFTLHMYTALNVYAVL